MLHAAVPAALEHVGEADEVRVDVGMRVGDGVAHAGLRGEMDDHVEALALEQCRHAGAIGEVEFGEREALERRQAREPRPLERDLVVVVDVVEADDALAAFEQPERGGRADESGRAGDEYVHGRFAWSRRL